MLQTPNHQIECTRKILHNFPKLNIQKNSQFSNWKKWRKFQLFFHFFRECFSEPHIWIFIEKYLTPLPKQVRNLYTSYTRNPPEHK